MKSTLPGLPQVTLSPAQSVAAGFLALIALGTGALCLPMAAAPGADTGLMAAFFTATSAVTMTGLSTVDIGSQFSGWGQGIIAALIQLGGLGVMSLATLAGLLLTGRVGLRARLNTRAENRSLGTGDIGRTLVSAATITVAVEAVVTVMIASRLVISQDMGWPQALWEGLFHAISAFNNAGFSLHSDNLISFVSDAWIIAPLAFSFIVGGLGYPVIMEILGSFLRRRDRRLKHWSLTTRITLTGTAVLIITGVGIVGVVEWNRAFAGMPTETRLLAAFFQGVTPRTAGFNSVDYDTLHPTTLMATDVLMFVGGGSAGTAGGIKITTAAVLLAAVFAEVKGESENTIWHRSISQPVIRQALTVTVLSAMMVITALSALRLLEPDIGGERLTFEVISAFATVGLSTGITDQLSTPSQLVLCALMYLGRIGPVTFIVALAARTKHARRFTYPTERPFIG